MNHVRNISWSCQVVIHYVDTALTLHDVDQVGVVLSLFDTTFEEFLQQDGDLYAIGRG
jgi:hypothetical protein